MRFRRTTLTIVAAAVSWVAVSVASSVDDAATVDEPAGRVGNAAQVADTLPPPPFGTTPYRLPVDPAANPGWHATHASYPATDIFLPCGAEVVSPVTGTLLEVRRIDSWDPVVDNPATRGGRSISILGDDGVRYYGAHYDTIEPGLAPGGRVTAGQRLGTLGDSGRTSACHLHFGISPPCPGTEWSVRRGVIWPHQYLDAWRLGVQLSPAAEVADWSAAHPDACAEAMADPYAPFA